MSNSINRLNDFEQQAIRSKFPNNTFHFHHYSEETEIVCFSGDNGRLVGIVSNVEWSGNRERRTMDFLLDTISNYVEASKSSSDGSHKNG